MIRGPKVGTLVSDRYRLTAALADNTMFAALDEKSSRHVAIKCLRPPQSIDAIALERFLRDAQTAGALDHPNVVTIYDVGFESNWAFIVMEPLEGESLATLLRRKPQLGIPEALESILPALAAVCAAHAHQVVHRALNPDNIFVNRHPDGTVASVKVLSFGVSTVADARNARPGALIGSPQYMAPEQVLGDAPVDMRTDVYAFGVMLYEALTRHRPFEADNHAAALWKLGNGEVQSPRTFCPALPPEVEAIVLRALLSCAPRSSEFENYLDANSRRSARAP